ncbi:hypothetical protein GE09DRAFT_317711 [Coniochaeta sp. 2T2.1]|nr:hypothetical protein GE09DRAFT_317711 [Coniochaeta sp. 2T2.1]
MTIAPMPRKCFVTTGSIASFRPLLEEILSLRFIQALIDHGFTFMEIQCGPDLEYVQNKLAKLRQVPIDITTFSLSSDIKEKMLECRGEQGVRHAGVIIGHAGSGTIMEALRYECPLIMVPNPSLLHNHQTEIATEIARRELAIAATLGTLPTALHQSRLQTAKRNLDSLPPYIEPAFPTPEQSRRKLLDWTVLTCYPDELARRLGDKGLPRQLSNASMDTDVDTLDAYDRELALDSYKNG